MFQNFGYIQSILVTLEVNCQLRVIKLTGLDVCSIQTTRRIHLRLAIFQGCPAPGRSASSSAGDLSSAISESGSSQLLPVQQQIQLKFSLSSQQQHEQQPSRSAAQV